MGSPAMAAAYEITKETFENVVNAMFEKPFTIKFKSHKDIVKEAIDRGCKVPDEVLADYKFAGTADKHEAINTPEPAWIWPENSFEPCVGCGSTTKAGATKANDFRVCDDCTARSNNINDDFDIWRIVWEGHSRG